MFRTCIKRVNLNSLRSKEKESRERFKQLGEKFELSTTKRGCTHKRGAIGVETKQSTNASSYTSWKKKDSFIRQIETNSDSSRNVHPRWDTRVITGNIGLAFFLRHVGKHLFAAALEIFPVARLSRGVMGVGKDAIAAEHVAPSKRLRGACLQMFAHRWGIKVINDVPRRC